MKNHFAYLKYLLKHKWFVFLACRKLKVSWIQSIIHDWSKFTPSEWFAYVKYFYSKKQEFIAGRITKSELYFDRAWNYHQKRNKHHYQFWILISDNGNEIRPIPIPEKYVREMIADWLGAGRGKTGSWNIEPWIVKNAYSMLFHSETKQLVANILLNELNMPLASQAILEN